MENPHWHYFVALDSELATISRYVELAEANYDTYSVEMTRLFLAASSEVDVVCKVLCTKIAPAKKRENIDDARRIITAKYSELYSSEIVLPRYGLTLVPWRDWKDNDTNPEWWQSYNQVKHHRYDHYKKANLKNALHAMAGLFVLVIYLYASDTKSIDLWPWPQVLSVKNEAAQVVLKFSELTHQI